MAPRVLFSAPPEHWPLWRPHLLAAFAEAGLDVDADRRPGRPLDLRLPRLPARRPGRRLHPLHPAEGGAEPLGRGRAHRRRPDPHRAALPHGRRRADPRHGRVGRRARAALPPRHSTRTSSARTASGGNGVVPPLAAGADRRPCSASASSAAAVAPTLAGLGFDVRGWSRRPREIAGHRHLRRRGRPRRACCARRRDPRDAAAGDARHRRTCSTRARLALLPDGRAADQSRPRHADRRRGAPRRARQRPPRPRDARRLPRRAAAARATPSGRIPASPSRRTSPPRPGPRPPPKPIAAQHPPRRGRPAVPPRGRPRRRLLTAAEPRGSGGIHARRAPPGVRPAAEARAGGPPARPRHGRASPDRGRRRRARPPRGR